MICPRCGNDITENSSICPACGTVLGGVKKSSQPSTTYGQFPQHASGMRPSDQHDASHIAPPFVPGVQPPPHFAQQPGAGVAQNTPPFYYQSNLHNGPGYHPPFTARSTPPFRKDTAMVTEFILSLFGLFGVGWIIAGSTVTGVLLLIGSVFIYWPLMIGGVILTRGIGLLCLGPIAIGAIILNTLLLMMALRRKTVRFVAPPPSSARNYPPF
jgi:hypothetical protein